MSLDYDIEDDIEDVLEGVHKELKNLHELVNRAIGIALAAREIAGKATAERIPLINKQRRLEWARILAPRFAVGHRFADSPNLSSLALQDLDTAIDAMIKWEDEQG